MVLKLSTTKIVFRSVDPEDETPLPEKTFIAIDTYVETSRKNEFILGDLFDYDGNKINYIWDSKKYQVASLKAKHLNTEVIVQSIDFLKRIYTKQNQSITVDVDKLTNNILEKLKESQPTIFYPQNTLNRELKKASINSANREDKPEDLDIEDDIDSFYNYESNTSKPIFEGGFLEDDEEVDDFDEQLALKSQEFLKKHPELKSEMEIVRLLEGN